MKPLFSYLLVLLSSAILMAAPSVIQRLPGAEGLMSLYLYQLVALLVAGSVILITWLVQRERLAYLGAGNLSSVASKCRALGISGRYKWTREGLMLLLVVSLATGGYMALALVSSVGVPSVHGPLLMHALLLAFLNSLSEEVIFRFGVVANLVNKVPSQQVMWSSAVLFGIPHYGGWPSGMPGVFLATALGYMLARAMVETRGMGIAWFIHFVQDVIIFNALFMMGALKV